MNILIIIRCSASTALWQRRCGFKFTVLDIGGGFSGKDSEIPVVTTIAASINSTIQDMRSEFPDLEVIAEPGGIFFALKKFLFLLNFF